MLAQSEQTNKEEEEIEEDETGQNKVNNSNNGLVNLDDDSSDDDENETDGTLFMHQSEQTIQSLDKQDTTTTEVEKVCKDWQAFTRTHCARITCQGLNCLIAQSPKRADRY